MLHEVSVINSMVTESRLVIAEEGWGQGTANGYGFYAA